MLGRTYQSENSLTMTNCTHTQRFVSKDLVRKPSLPVTQIEGGSWALLRTSAFESTITAQPFV